MTRDLQRVPSTDLGLPIERILAKLRCLPAERRVEVEAFVDVLLAAEEERRIRTDFMRLSEVAFAKVWDNAEDAAYDRL